MSINGIKTAASRQEKILRLRYRGLYLSRQCPDIRELSQKLLGLHCWFHRNVVFSALIRGAELSGWKYALTKTWLYRGTLHGVESGDLPKLLSLHRGNSWLNEHYGERLIEQIAEEVLRYMEDGVYTRAEMRKLFSEFYEPGVIGDMFSSWGGIFVHLARLGRVAFRDMTSRDFDLIDAEPRNTPQEVLPELLRRYLESYGPATLDDAAWFFGFLREDKKLLRNLSTDEYGRFELGGRVYYHCEEPEGVGDIPKYNLLSGFDPVIVSYVERSAILPSEYKGRVILKSGICLPSVAVNGKIAGLWNIKNGEPVVEFFSPQSASVKRGVFESVDEIRRRSMAVK